MLAFRIAEHLNVFEHVMSSVVSCQVDLTPDAFPFQKLEEALGDGIVMALAASAHAGFQIVLAEKRLPLAAGELGTLIEMHHDLASGLALPDGHQQSLQSELRRHARLCRPADDTAREQFDDEALVQPAFMGLDLSDVGHPDLIGRSDLELLLQPVLGHDGWLATIPSRAPLKANLCSDPSEKCQTRHPVLGNLFALVTQAVRQLAIAIDFATGRSGMPDQLYLTRILLRTVA